MSDLLDILVSAPPGGDVLIAVGVPDESPVCVLMPAPAPLVVTVTTALPGSPGTSITPVVLTLDAYLALTTAAQLDASKFYVIPKTS